MKPVLAAVGSATVAVLSQSSGVAAIFFAMRRGHVVFKINKMAQTSASIRVSVLEGCYAHLLAVGVPLPLCIHLQELAVRLNSAQWTAKQSSTGFSVSFFWPASGHQPFRPEASKPRRRRRKKNNISNYRPISLLCSVSKVLERLIYDKISSFTLAQVTNNQFGFMPNHSCLQQLLVFVDSVVRCQERKSQLDVVYVDIRKAFDSVPHGELL